MGFAVYRMMFNRIKELLRKAKKPKQEYYLILTKDTSTPLMELSKEDVKALRESLKGFKIMKLDDKKERMEYE